MRGGEEEREERGEDTPGAGALGVHCSGWGEDATGAVQHDDLRVCHSRYAFLRDVRCPGNSGGGLLSNGLREDSLDPRNSSLQINLYAYE